MSNKLTIDSMQRSKHKVNSYLIWSFKLKSRMQCIELFLFTLAFWLQCDGKQKRVSEPINKSHLIWPINHNLNCECWYGVAQWSKTWPLLFWLFRSFFLFCLRHRFVVCVVHLFILCLFIHFPWTILFTEWNIYSGFVIKVILLCERGRRVSENERIKKS